MSFELRASDHATDTETRGLHPKMRCVGQSDHGTANRHADCTTNEIESSVLRTTVKLIIGIISSYKAIIQSCPLPSFVRSEAEIMSTTKPSPAHSPISGSYRTTTDRRFRRRREIELVGPLCLPTNNWEVTLGRSSALQTRRSSFQSRTSPFSNLQSVAA
ncbi:hypothetical protein BDV10DRAFT_110613 [Aspergillus recurvatus]